MLTFEKVCGCIQKHLQDYQIGVEVYLVNRPLFYYLDPHLSADKYDWLRRKRNTALRFAMSSQAMQEKCKGDENLLVTKYGLPLKDYTLTPGAVCLFKDNLLIGTVTVTGLKPQEDHLLAQKIAADLEFDS